VIKKHREIPNITHAVSMKYNLHLDAVILTDTQREHTVPGHDTAWRHHKIPHSQLKPVHTIHTTQAV